MSYLKLHHEVQELRERVRQLEAELAMFRPFNTRRRPQDGGSGAPAHPAQPVAWPTPMHEDPPPPTWWQSICGSITPLRGGGHSFAH